MLANKAITRIRDFTYLGSNVSEDGGTCKDVETRMQKARGALTRLRKIWIAHYVNKDTKIKLFNVYVKSVLLYGCQTWLVTCEIQRKIQSFVNRCLRYIMNSDVRWKIFHRKFSRTENFPENFPQYLSRKFSVS
jgi:hypothetical protein